MQRHIWVIDDDEVFCAMLKRVLEEEDYRVTTFTDIQMAERKMRQLRPELVFLDLKMPGGGGMQFLKQFRKKFPDTPVYILTGHGDLQSAREALKYGATEFVGKPIELKKLKSMVKEALVAA